MIISLTQMLILQYNPQMLEIETESILDVQQRVGYKAEKGDVLVRKRRIFFAPEMIGQITINLPSRVGVYNASPDEIGVWLFVISNSSSSSRPDS